MGNGEGGMGVGHMVRRQRWKLAGVHGSDDAVDWRWPIPVPRTTTTALVAYDVAGKARSLVWGNVQRGICAHRAGSSDFRVLCFLVSYMRSNGCAR